MALGWLTYVTGTISYGSIARRYAALHRLLVAKYYVDEVYQWATDRVVLAFAGFVAVFDRIVVNDTGVDGSAKTVMLSAFRLRYMQSGRMYNYALAMVLGVVGLALVWWLVQT